MKKTLAVALLTGAALFGAAAPALAADAPGVVVVDEPDTSGLNNIWTFAPLGVPVLGLIQSINGVPGKILPSF
ncbi:MULTISPECIES: hypothetical protein [Amycolatopsis]|uniref:Uncharacterized protein n=1 Tax=Amycolatopsis eburnea TaxID=2267691 RepID=A0A3R9EQU7_9PSEU|nr:MULTISPECIES: hypothetical protein [Amycolatopsis]NBH02817.1 hypothetical protein [Amycolatopsis sp. SID8362]NED39519.1 hypothetical protein [Amycolatopsis sp. SID8362]RSD17794.1 hypothetical protein EIY87_18955 [Amycolatopsis eburnea]